MAGLPLRSDLPCRGTEPISRAERVAGEISRVARGVGVVARGVARGVGALARGVARGVGRLARGVARGVAWLARGVARGVGVVARGAAREAGARPTDAAREDCPRPLGLGCAAAEPASTSGKPSPSTAKTTTVNVQPRRFRGCTGQSETLGGWCRMISLPNLPAQGRPPKLGGASSSRDTGALNPHTRRTREETRLFKKSGSWLTATVPRQQSASSTTIAAGKRDEAAGSLFLPWPKIER